MNVVLICLDTYRADCVRAAGRNDFIRTPNMDRLINEGVLFNNAFGEGHPTIQYRRALITGMRSFPFDRDYDTKGLWPVIAGWHKVPPEQPTLAEVLLENGFSTGLAADTYHMFKPTQNFTRGMASWEFIRGQETDNWRSGPLDKLDLAKYIVPGSKPNPMAVQYLLNMQDREGELDYLPAQVFSSAIQFVEDNKANRPFFLWVDSFDPHEPWDPPAGYADHYAPGWDEDWEPVFGGSKDERVNERKKALYYGECEFVDKQIGRLIETLEANDLYDDTLIIVTSDHGTELQDHGAFNKGPNKCRYRHNNEILMLMRLPGGDCAGNRVDGFVMNQDIMPTILGQLGVECPSVDGVDITPLARGDVDGIREYVITGWAGGESGIMANVRDHDFSYACMCFDEDPKETLFDLDADPGEMNNIAADRADIVDMMRDRLETYFGEKLPAKPRHKCWPTTPPMAVWWNNAAWAKRIKE